MENAARPRDDPHLSVEEVWYRNTKLIHNHREEGDLQMWFLGYGYKIQTAWTCRWQTENITYVTFQHWSYSNYNNKNKCLIQTTSIHELQQCGVAWFACIELEVFPGSVYMVDWQDTASIYKHPACTKREQGCLLLFFSNFINGENVTTAWMLAITMMPFIGTADGMDRFSLHHVCILSSSGLLHKKPVEIVSVCLSTEI